MVDAALLERQKLVEQAVPPGGVNKWEALREISTARAAFGLSDRDMAVLQALLSFHPETILGGNSAELVVHPSNRVIAERLGGMPCSTMRRHLGNLVCAGIVARRDSPNGKRYARRVGEEKIAFGFDLTPMLVRYDEFCAAAEAVRAEKERFQRLRETVSLMRRDLAGLASYGADVRPDVAIWPRLDGLAALTARALRRTLSYEDLATIECDLLAGLEEARATLDGQPAEEMITNDAVFEQHYQNSNTNLHDSELRVENAKAADVTPKDDGPFERPDTDAEGPLPFERNRLPNLPLGLVLSVCSEILTYTDGRIRHWHELVRAADTVRSMMGVSPSAWQEAKNAMGPEEAAVVLAAMLQRFGEIKSPGGYLRHLSGKAAAGGFSCGPMIMALMRRDAA